MKYFSYLIVIFYFTTVTFAQQITIPFRDGDKWGFCDQEGKMLIAPQFESYEFGKSYSSSYEFIITKNNNLNGLVIDGKEVLGLNKEATLQVELEAEKDLTAFLIKELK